MFTVLIRFRSDAREQLFSAKSVRYHPKEGLRIFFNDTETSHFAAPEGEDALEEGLFYADVYVMNKEGKTVARYVL